MVEVVVEFIAGLVMSLAVAVFAQFGVDLQAGEQPARPEVRRTVQPAPTPAEPPCKTAPAGDC